MPMFLFYSVKTKASKFRGVESSTAHFSLGTEITKSEGKIGREECLATRQGRLLPCRDVFHLSFAKRARLGQCAHTSFLRCETFLAHDVRKYLLQKA